MAARRSLNMLRPFDPTLGRVGPPCFMITKAASNQTESPGRRGLKLLRRNWRLSGLGEVAASGMSLRDCGSGQRQQMQVRK
jgi:hypothetical protein